MAINYDEAIADLREEEKRLESELAQIRAAIPALVMMRNRKQSSETKPPDLVHLPGWQAKGMRFAGFGATKAIPELLKDAPVAMTSGEIQDALSSQGWTTKAQKPVGVVSATLVQLEESGIVERVGDGWKLKKSTSDLEMARKWESTLLAQPS